MRTRKDKTTENISITASEAEAIRRDKEHLESMAGAGEMTEAGFSPTAQIDDLAVDKDAIRKKIRVLEQQLDAHKNQRVNDSEQRSRIHARRKALEEKFKDYLESYRDLGVIRRDDPNWNAAFQKALRRGEVEHLITEWRKLGLMLEPEDPFINNLDRLRRD